MGQPPAVDRCRRDHRKPHSVAAEPRDLGYRPVGVAQREVRDGEQPSAARRCVFCLPPVARSEVAGQRFVVAREHLAQSGVDVIAPHRARLEQVLVCVDGAHVANGRPTQDLGPGPCPNLPDLARDGVARLPLKTVVSNFRSL
jgi:hypothetical protein